MLHQQPSALNLLPNFERTQKKNTLLLDLSDPEAERENELLLQSHVPETNTSLSVLKAAVH